ncbi:hypothetical protein [Bradyrhizobium sp.]|uniref:hypothetical protein n=1 Tax=Bradyrhizobium sp. TaxID=376 RepID=UPI001D4CD3F4|nr:hypothetical protein [Bradyrhizobium sp.]MBV8699560.1 hypothetical protein [Bradyrhizobium sp.]MBV9985572.1 hypothetical protein [Bradyrhizobium sp.]
MKIKPLQQAAAGRGYSEHRTVRAADLRTPGGDEVPGADIISEFIGTEQGTAAGDEPQYQLRHGDRVIIRHLDKEPSRPEFYTISSTDNDPINGFLHVKTTLAEALAKAAPGDEFTYIDAGQDRPVLFVSLETAAAQAA